MKVPMFDLEKQSESLFTSLQHAFTQVVKSNHFILGDQVRLLEETVANYSGAKESIGVASGSDALYFALLASGIKPGDEVITTPFTFFATAGAILRCQAKPVFVDIDPKTFNIDPFQIEEKITPKTKAIIVVHLYGMPVELDPILALAEHYQLKLIQDAAQAIGAKYEQRALGTMGDAVCYSFFPTKNLGGFGDGGMITTNNPELTKQAKMLRAHGSKEKYRHEILGYNSRLDELQAAILNIKFPYLELWNAKRQQKAQVYTQLINQSVGELVKTPYVPPNTQHVFHQYTILVEERDALQKFLNENDIQTTVYYPIPLHLQPIFEHRGYQEGDYPNAEKASKLALSLPMFPEITESQQIYVVEKIAEFYKRRED